MAMNKGLGKASGSRGKNLLAAIALVVCFSAVAWSQNTASVAGTLRDSSGAIMPDAKVTVKHVESGLVRTVKSDASGNYSVVSIPVGEYEISAEQSGFKVAIRKGIVLVVGQQAVVNLTLEVGAVEQQVTVTGEASLVDTSTATTSGLVGEKEVKDLPLNGRSFDQLLTLNIGVANYSSNTSHNAFSVVGRRPEENRFIINGVEYVGTDYTGQLIQPTGVSGNVLGVDAVREFNVVGGAYGAEYGKRAGAQVNIVTSSGTNQLHGDAFEFLRNSDLDANNYFSNIAHITIPPYKRNQFGGSLGGPIKKDKLFIFGNYEGLRQAQGASAADSVPDHFADQGLLPCGSSTGLACGASANGTELPVPNLQSKILPYLATYWPIANGPEIGAGLAFYYASPVTSIADNFGLTRVDYNISEKDTLSGSYLIDRGTSSTPSANPIVVTNAGLHSQVVSIQENHIFSPSLLNAVTIGFARGLATSLASTPGVTPAPPFVTGTGIGEILLGNQGNVSVTIGGNENGFVSLFTARNAFTESDDLHWIRGIHSFSFGGWFQRNQENISGPVAFLSGQVSYPTMLAMLQDTPSAFYAVPDLSNMSFRSIEAAWYVKDEIKLKDNLTLSVGLRDEMTNGWNEAFGRASNYLYTNGVLNTNTTVGTSALTQNNAKALFQPRAAIAWDPSGKGTWAIRAGAGVYNTLQDNLAHRLVVNEPYNAQLEIDSTPVFSITPIAGGLQPPGQCQTVAQLATIPSGCTSFQPGGIEPNFKTPRVQQWNLTVERELGKNLLLQVTYTGSEASHLLVSTDTNVSPPQICNNSAGCLAGGTGGVPVVLGGTLAAGKLPSTAESTVPQGTLYMPVGPRLNPVLGSPFDWNFEGTSSYNAVSVSLLQRLSHGLSFKVNYSYAKLIDDNSAISASGGTNEAQTILDPYILGMSRGLAAYDLTHQFNFNYTYELPVGKGKPWASGVSGVTDKLISGWQWNGIFTAQSGFPFEPTAGTNRSGTGDTRNPDVPSWNPAFTGSVITGTQAHWFNGNAFQLPAFGTFGNAGRNELIGPRLFDFDTSLFKTFKVSERFRLEFRAEAFNLFNHSNLGHPLATVFSGASVSPTAGQITTLAVQPRQMQFALKLLF